MRKLFIILVGCLLVLFAGYVGYRGYKVWKQNHLLSMARDFLSRSDQRNALLSVQQVIRSNPRNVQAVRMMAEFADATRSPGALLWRSRVVELNPNSLEDRLALAQTALTMRDLATATNALAGVLPADKKTAPYHNMAGVLAAGGNDPVRAETHFVEAVKLQPENPFYQLSLAVVRLGGSNEPARVQARTALLGLGANPTNGLLRCQALREMVADELRQKDWDAALRLLRRLESETNSVFSDGLLQLSVLQQQRSADFKPTLAARQHEAAADPKKVWELGMWQMANLSTKETLAWLQGLPGPTRNASQVGMLIAECHALDKDWRGLQAAASGGDWAELEFIRHAFMSLALREQNLAGAAKAEWELAYKGAEAQRQGLVVLLQFAGRWNWLSEGEELLRVIVNRHPGDKWAGELLAQVLMRGGRTRSLMQFYSQELKRNASDPVIKNNLAITALLLDAQELKPHELALEVYQKYPSNASFASTFAYSLHVQNRNPEALKVMEQLKPRELEDPAVAGYYGLVLKEAGNRTKARAYLEWSAKAFTLPEERKMFDAARSGL